MSAITQQEIIKDAILSFLVYSLKGNYTEKSYLLGSGLKKRWHDIAAIKTQYECDGALGVLDSENDSLDFVEFVGQISSQITPLGLSTHAHYINWQDCTQDSVCSVNYKLDSSEISSMSQLRLDIANLKDVEFGISVELSYVDGRQQVVDVVLEPKISRYLTKLDALLKRKSSEVAFDTISMDLDASNQIKGVKLVIENDESGALFIDNLVLL